MLELSFFILCNWGRTVTLTVSLNWIALAFVALFQLEKNRDKNQRDFVQASAKSS